MKKLILGLLFLTQAMSLTSQMECYTEDQNHTSRNSLDCDFITPNHTIDLPKYIVKLAIHFIGDPDIANGENFYDGMLNDWNNMNGNTNVFNMLNQSNELLEAPHINPIGAENFINDTRIRLEVFPNIEEGVFYWEKEADVVKVPGVLNILFIDKFTPPEQFHFNGIACSIGQDCDEIKIWGWQSSERLDGPWKSWNYGRILNHEVGHVLGLRHSFSSSNECKNIDIDPTLENNGGDRWNSGSKNTMNYVNCQCAFSPCQWSHIYTNLYNGVFSFSEEECAVTEFDDINVTGNVTWETRVLAMNDIIVSEGSTLTIKCIVELNEDSKIIVMPTGKLIIDGGVLTDLIGCTTDSWVGIKIAGGNSDFDLEVKNGAIIENTSQAAITMWPTNSSNPANGIAQIENSTFNNVRGAVGFFARTSSNNGSFVKNCTINDSRWGISNTNCHNIEVSGNTFNNTELECIFGSMGSYHIHNDNTFLSGQQDILFMNTSPTLSSVIENNRFYGRNTGYHADGSVFSQNRIEFNQFYNGEIDILNDGHNSFRAWSNLIHADLGAVSFSNGDRSGEYGFNTFENNFIAQLPVGTNPGFNFYENCYNSSFTDVYIDGSIASIVQQSFGDAANNCFTHDGNSSTINDLGGNPDPFTYVEPDDNDIDCRDAINAHSIVNVEKTGPQIVTPECYDPFTTPPTVAFSPCNPQEGQEEAARLWLLNKISEIESNPNLSESQKNRLLSIYRICLKKVIGIITEIHVELGAFDDARSLYQPELSDDDKVMVYGLYIIEGDLVSASSYVNGLSSESEKLMDFKTTQLSNLQRIQSNYIYEPSTIELAEVKTIAEKDHPYAAYAKALYYAYTGEVLVSSFPVFVRNELENRSQRSIANNKSASINPNPFRDQLNVTLVGLDNPIIRVCNIMGKHQYGIEDILSTTINTSTWSEGIYILQVLDGTELIKTQKVVLVK